MFIQRFLTVCMLTLIVVLAFGVGIEANAYVSR